MKVRLITINLIATLLILLAVAMPVAARDFSSASTGTNNPNGYNGDSSNTSPWTSGNSTAPAGSPRNTSLTGMAPSGSSNLGTGASIGQGRMCSVSFTNGQGVTTQYFSYHCSAYDSDSPWGQH